MAARRFILLVAITASVAASPRPGRVSAQPGGDLARAALAGDAAAVARLIERGVDVEDADRSGQTPLQTASRGGHSDVVRLLLGHGADPNRASAMKYTALIFASFGGHREIMEMLVDEGAAVDARASTGVTPLLAAAASSNPSAVRLLVDAGAGVGARDARGNTPLMFAAATGNVESIEILLEAGADVAARSHDGYDPIRLARLYGRDAARSRLGGGPDVKGFGDAMTMQSGVTPPTLDEQSACVFTDDAVHRGVEGEVLLTLVVATSGRVGDVRVTDGLDIGLDLKAIECVRQWRFTPGAFDGKPVDVVGEVVVEFDLL